MKFKILLLIIISLASIKSECQSVDEFSFDKYKITSPNNSKKAAIDYASNPLAKMYRTRISDGYKLKNIDFAGYYIVVTWGCGTGCILGAMVDVRDGKVYTLPLGEETAYSFSCSSIFGTDDDRIVYKKDSKLFITTHCSENEINNSGKYKDDVTYFINIWDENKKEFKLEKTIKKSIMK